MTVPRSEYSRQQGYKKRAGGRCMNSTMNSKPCAAEVWAVADPTGCGGVALKLEANQSFAGKRWADMDDCSWQQPPQQQQQQHVHTQPAGVSIAGLAESTQKCDAVIKQLESTDRDKAEKHLLIQRLLPDMHKLALSKPGCRVVQKALEVGGNEARDIIWSELKSRVAELYESPNGNHVLQNIIKNLSAQRNSEVISALRQRGAVTVAKHRYGCRVLCRLIEQCDDTDAQSEFRSLLDELIPEMSVLARHEFGTFVVQTMLEYLKDRRPALIRDLIPHAVAISMNRAGSLAMQKMHDFCDLEEEAAFLSCFLNKWDPQSGSSFLAVVAYNRYGSYVLEQLAGSRSEELRGRMAEELTSCFWGVERTNLGHAERVVDAFGLVFA